jgi:hypothetical protein
MGDESGNKADRVPGPEYVPPQVVFHSREEILRAAGPAVGCARWNTIAEALGQQARSQGHRE